MKTNHLSRPLNPLLADIFYKSGYIEGWGRGTLKIIDECRKDKLPEPGFENKGHLFSVTFFKTDLKTDLKISLPEKQIIDLISSDPKVPIPEMAKKMGKGITVTKLLPGKMKSDGLIRRVGGAKGGHWEVVSEK